MPEETDSVHDPWCVEHDPSGTCLGDVRALPSAGAAWIEGGAEPRIVVSLGRSDSGRRLPGLDAADARAVAAALEELADQVEEGTSSPDRP